ncbi:MAG TPA: DNA polymerase IV [Bacillus bacterium]|uniref:DNA polymerase IV n=1 Tax=Siminovitchia fordii TaxID=254759 RepID=A0ABQ4K429_9BACI|nr:DNA polymerase IV [Siminovitchia fordii]GIN19922.1 DNA polymerase IV [Siminovitchia fordii]HBZ08594.1 DNA polymerase IV [Bacillus sp. (in: firmicutes)]
MKEFYPKMGRVILHVDMNSFFASVEIANDPSLKGKPLAIAGDAKQRKGIIVTCSYEAREYGVKTTMQLWEAKKLCPKLIVKQPNHERYRLVSQAIFDLLRKYSDLVEPVSIDEGYVDITDCQDLGKPVQIAEMIQKDLLKTLDLPCSIGIAPNKFLAKMASDMKKPLGISILRKRDVPAVLWPLPVIEMHGIGEKTAKKLELIHVKTIRDLAHANDLQLQSAIGIHGIRLKERANGIDPRKVDPDAAAVKKSIGSSITLPRDISNQSELLSVLEKLSDNVASRLKRKQYVTKNVSVMIKYKNRETITRSRMLENPIVEARDIFKAAKTLFIKNWNGHPVRLLGITGQDLLKADHSFEQLSLFSYEKVAKKEPLYEAIDQMKKKYGSSILRTGAESPHPENKKKS